MTKRTKEFRIALKERLLNHPAIWREIAAKTVEHKENKKSKSGGFSKHTVISVLYRMTRYNDKIINRSLVVLNEKEKEDNSVNKRMARILLELSEA